MAGVEQAAPMIAAGTPKRRVSLHGEPGSRVIAIVGAGFSGTMAAIHLRHALPPNYVVYLFDRSGRFARGPAYAPSGARHLLNVRAVNMSAFPADPGHFDRWLAERSARAPTEVAAEIEGTDSGTFATRRLYGRYLRALLYQEMTESGGRVRLAADEVATLAECDGGWRLSCTSGRQVMAAAVVLAAGNLRSEQASDGVTFYDPWAEEATDWLRPAQPVLVVGTGLTMVDLVLGMHARGFQGPIIALSRRGLVPHRHEHAAASWPTPVLREADRSSLPRLLSRVRAEVREAARRDIGWRPVLDSLRPITAELWRGLPPTERSRFLRHLRPYWDVHRHRAAPPAADSLAALIARGTLKILRGRIRKIDRVQTGARVEVQDRAAGIRVIDCQRVIYATGVGSVPSGDGLIAHLLADGIARPDAHEMGLDVTERLQVIGGNGAPAPHLWALGPIVRGVFWECTAVPDIRVQASLIAAEVGRQLAQTPSP